MASQAMQVVSPSELTALARGAPALLIVYGAGVAASLSRLAWRWFALRRLLRKAGAPDTARLKGAASTLPVRISDRAASALLIGVRRPVIVLPAHALDEMTPAQLRWVLAHEEAHARRGDNPRLLAEAVLAAVLWFNPFVTWAAAMAAAAREQLCDRSVLGAAGAAERRAYAATLLLALRLGARASLASTLISPGKRRLSMRLVDIVNPARPTPAKAAASVGAIVAAGALTCAVGAAAWAQTPPSDGWPTATPIDIQADHVTTYGCEAIWSGNVSVVSGGRRLKADQVRVVQAGAPGKCGRSETLGALANVVYESQGHIERGQSAEIDLRTGGVVVKP